MVPRLARIDDWKDRKERSAFLHSPTLKVRPNAHPSSLETSRQQPPAPLQSYSLGYHCSQLARPTQSSIDT